MVSLKSSHSEVKRSPGRASYDKSAILKILSDGSLCHIALSGEHYPILIPMFYFMYDDKICIHGSKGSRLINQLKAGTKAAVSVAHLDGLVLAKSMFHHSLNYRSAVVFGEFKEVEVVEHSDILEKMMNSFIPGRFEDSRLPSAVELKQTVFLVLDVLEGGAKIREGMPVDDVEDKHLPHWSGVIPLCQKLGEPLPDEYCHEKVPEYIHKYFEEN